MSGVTYLVISARASILKIYRFLYFIETYDKSYISNKGVS